MKNFSGLLLLSASPRRKEILSMLGLPFRVFTEFSVDEVLLSTPEETVVENALLKLKSGMNEKKNDEIAIAADTIVCIEGTVIGKPKNAEEAESFLSMLSGRVHRVFTGFAVAIDTKIITGFETTSVEFKKLSDNEIKWYIDTKEPFDKAGAYGIQGKGVIFVKSMKGDFFNVMGLPIAKIYDILFKNEVDLKKLGG